MRIANRRIPYTLVALLTLALVFAGIGPGGDRPEAVEAAPAAAQVRPDARRIEFAASVARTATGTGAAVCGLAPYTKFAAQTVVTAASGTTPTLDVTWQHSIDGGVTWFTVTTFAQKTTTGTELKAEAEVEAATAEVYGDCMRAIWTIGGTTPSFTFSVKAFVQ